MRGPVKRDASPLAGIIGKQIGLPRVLGGDIGGRLQVRDTLVCSARVAAPNGRFLV
jgi:hypothetical protein